MAGTFDSAADHCQSMVRERDIDHYLATLFVPQPHRQAVFSLYAFDGEISHIRNVTKEPMMGEVRLQWWREVLGGKRDGEAANNPVAATLIKAIADYQLPAQTFDNYLEARIFDLYNDPMPDTHSLEGYAGETASSLFYLAATIVGGKQTTVTADCAGHAGVVWTIINILKSLPHHRIRQQCYIPADILEAAGVSLEDYMAGEQNTKTDRLVGNIAALAMQHLAHFQKCAAGLPDDVRSVFLPVSLVKHYLKRFENAGAKALVAPTDIAQWRKQIILWRAARKGAF